MRFQEYPDAKLGIFAPSKTNSMDPLEINKVEIRNLQREDYDQLAASFTRVYADGSDVFWTPEQIDKLIRIFPRGADRRSHRR